MSLDPSQKLRVALVGAGYVAGHHLSALKALDFVEVVGIADTTAHEGGGVLRKGRCASLAGKQQECGSDHGASLFG